MPQFKQLTSNLSGNIRKQSSQPAEPLWTVPVIKSGISMRNLIATSKKEVKKRGGGGSEWWNILQKSSHARIMPPPPSLDPCVLSHARLP